MKIPYGISNFAHLRKDNYLYVDKTRFVEILENENSPYQFLIRPRRFGKSLFISLLENYYDIKNKEGFDDLFKGLYIGDNPTPLKNSYLILRFSFAAIITGESRERLIDSFDFEVSRTVQYSLKKYESILGKQQLPGGITGAEQVIKFFITKAHEAEQKVFVLIDEYDNFANDLIGTGNTALYYDLMRSEGYVRAFYKALKDGTLSSVYRIFVTGVSPIMLDDLTSGFNITDNFTNNETMNEIMGFNEDEVKGIVKGVIDECASEQNYSVENVLVDLKHYYNGYLFSERCKTQLYNSDMVLYFINFLSGHKRYPDSMIDDNVKVDYRKIRQLAFNFKDGDLIEKILKEGEVTSVLITRFSLEEMFNKRENFISILYYLGMLTIKERRINKLRLCIPNYVIKTIYWEYYVAKNHGDGSRGSSRQG